MKVVLDALWLDPGRSGGPETYLRGLAPALARGFPSLDLHVATLCRTTGITLLTNDRDHLRIARYVHHTIRPLPT